MLFRSERRDEDADLGGTMRLGAYDAVLKEGSRVAQIYGTTRISERHRHRYEVNIGYREQLEAHGLVFSGLSPDASCRRSSRFPITPGISACSFTPN